MQTQPHSDTDSIRGAVRLRATGAAHPDRQLLDALYEAIVVADEAGWIVQANRRALDLLGYTLPELREMTVPQVFSGVGRSVVQKIREHVADGRFTVIEVPCLRKDGTRFFAEAAVGRLLHGPAAQLVFSLRNVDQRRTARTRLREEHDALESMMSILQILSTADVIRLISLAGKNGRLHIGRSNGEHGTTIAFADGQVISAVCEGLTGEPGFCRAVSHDGMLRFEDGEAGPRDASIQRSTMSLLLEAVQQSDERIAESGDPPGGA